MKMLSRKTTWLPMISILAIAVIILTGIYSVWSAKSSFASGVIGWNAGNIIDDGVMTNTGTMTPSSIQSFLNKEVPTCDTNGTQLSEYGGPDLNGDGKVQRWEWGKANYNQTTFICLKNYKENGLTAAQIIYNAAKKYTINPQVLLVLLQKEQSLVTDTWPLNLQYRTAAGYGCPDTAPCSTQYYGLTNQINWAAKMYHAIMTADPNWYTPYILGKDYIQYNPSSSCGGSTVTIENRATQALYNYTPYQPNKAALEAGWGTATCGAYGNRNFYLYFTKWFGSTTGDPLFTVDGSTIYIDGANETYYHVPNEATLTSYGYKTLFRNIRMVDPSYLSSRTNKGDLPLIAQFGGTAIYAVASSTLYHFPDETTYYTYGYNFSDAAQLPPGLDSTFRKGKSMTTTLAAVNDSAVYTVSGGKRHHIVNMHTYTAAGNPIYSTRAISTLDQNFVNSLSQGTPILLSDTLVKAPDGSVYYWDGTSLSPLEASLVSQMAIPTDTITSSDVSMLPIVSKKIGLFVKDSNGTIYALYKKAKYPLLSQDITKLAVSSDSIQLVDNAFLGQFTPLNPRASYIRFGVDTMVYKYTPGDNIYRILDEYDFYKMGGDFKNVVSVAPYLKSLYTDKGYQFSSKRLVQVTGQSPVYIVDSNFNMYHIPTEEIARQYKISLTNKAYISSLDQASAYTLVANGLTRIVKASTGEVWLVDSGYRYTLSSSQLQDNLGFSSSSTFTTLPPELLSLTTIKNSFNPYALDKSNGRVYKIENGNKSWFTTEQALSKIGKKWTDATVYSHDYLNILPNGANIN